MILVWMHLLVGGGLPQRLSFSCSPGANGMQSRYTANRFALILTSPVLIRTDGILFRFSEVLTVLEQTTHETPFSVG